MNTVRRYHTSKPVNTARWHMEIELLLKSAEEKEITQVLAWWQENYKRMGVPRVCSAISFRRHYWTLKRLSEAAPGSIELSPVLERILHRIRPLGWPMGLDNKLPWLLSQGYDNYSDFWKSLADYHAGQHSIPCAWPGLVSYLRSTYLISPGGFIENWLQDGFQEISNWKGFSGDPQHLLFQNSAQRFHRVGQDWTYAYCSDSDKWNQLMQVIGCE